MQRKVFRIEEMMPRSRPAARPAAPAMDVGVEMQRLRRELESVYDAIDRSKRELIALHGNAAEDPRLPRAERELGAAIGAMESATQKIIKAAEAADESARNLTATLKDDYKRGLAQDIQDNVVQIYEACHFQDLTGQRINKAIAALQSIDQGLARVFEIWGGLDQFRRHAPAPSHKLINGPKLEGDAGHASQHDIDRMFG